MIYGRFVNGQVANESYELLLTELTAYKTVLSAHKILDSYGILSMKPFFYTFVFFYSASVLAFADIPQSVEEAWADFDAQAEPLGIELIREENEGGIIVRYVRFVVGTFDGKKTKVSAFYGFPEGAKRLPGLVQVHGGGQFARKTIVKYYASRGYAVIAVNWGEKVIDKKDDANTDWAGIPAGFLDPKHHNGVEAGEGTIYDVAHPWNSSWLLYSAAARRAITFLERQAECDGNRIGLQGHSMGGRLTVLTAIDPRIKAASPSVGGSGYLYTDIVGIPGSARHMQAGLDRDLYLKTLDCKDYWPLIKCPVMFLGATNDFNSPMEFVIRGFRSLPNDDGVMSFTPHMNHRFTADNMAARIRWFDTHLKNSFSFPKSGKSSLELKTKSGIPRFSVEPDQSVKHEIKKVSVFYGYDRDPRARFWRSADVNREGDIYSADCPVMLLGEPLFVFSNVTYDTKDHIEMPAGFGATSLLTVTSECRKAYPHQLKEAGVKAVAQRQRLIEDFTNGWQDWSLVGVGHRAHWNYETHKVNDPAYRGPKGALLALEIEVSDPGDTLAVVLYTDQWRGYTGRKPKRYTALIMLEKAGLHSISLPMKRFVAEDGRSLETYDFVTSLILTPGQKERPDEFKTEWRGCVPTFKNIRWVGGEFAPRQRPYLRSGASGSDADAAFRRSGL